MFFINQSTLLFIKIVSLIAINYTFSTDDENVENVKKRQMKAIKKAIVDARNYYDLK